MCQLSLNPQKTLQTECLQYAHRDLSRTKLYRVPYRIVPLANRIFFRETYFLVREKINARTVFFNFSLECVLWVSTQLAHTV